MIDLHSPSVQETIKFFLAIIIVISHLGMPVLCDINYLPVGLFFFMSGYGLYASYKNGHNFKLINSIKKILIPFYFAEIFYCIVYTDMFVSLTCFERVIACFKALILFDIPLPYSWYVRAQLI